MKNTDPKSTLIEGDAIDFENRDLIFQSVYRANTDGEPDGKYWRILTGNNHMSRWVRLIYRYEIETKATS